MNKLEKFLAEHQYPRNPSPLMQESSMQVRVVDLVDFLRGFDLVPKIPRKILLCSHCRSSNVFADAAAKWDTDNQAWDMVGCHETNLTCEDCGGETSAYWENLSEWKVGGEG